MRSNTSLFERYFESLEKAVDVSLRLQFQKSMFKKMLFEEGLYDRIVSDCTAKVLNNISVNSNVQKVVSEIVKEINKELNNIGK